MDTAQESVGTKLRALWDRSGLSLGDIAKALGRPKSTVQRMFAPEYRPGGHLALEESIAFAGVFTGTGTPPIENGDILALTALPQVNETLRLPMPELPLPVATAMAEEYAAILLQGQAPRPGAVANLARVIRGLAALYQRDPTMRADAPRTRGALQSLALQETEKQLVSQ